MAHDLYHTEPYFAENINQCCDYLEPSIKSIIFPLITETATNREIDEGKLADTAILQPILFIIEYSLAKLLMAWGIKPDAMIGHSIGEYVAACLANVFSLEDALNLVCIRSRLMAKTDRGSMLAIACPEHEITSYLTAELSLAVVNTNKNCVVSGAVSAIDDLEKQLQKREVFSRKLRTSHAFHSHQMDTILGDFHAAVSNIKLNPPSLPIISNVTGNWLTTSEAINPDYWTNHLRHTVRFFDGIKTLLQDRYDVFIEIGPGKTLAHFVNEVAGTNTSTCVKNSLPAYADKVTDQECLLSVLGELWLRGFPISWLDFYKYEHRKRIPLPTYPFEREYFWVKPDIQDDGSVLKKNVYDKWFYEQIWTRFTMPVNHEAIRTLMSSEKYFWLIFIDDQNKSIGNELFLKLRQFDQLAVTIISGEKFVVINNNTFVINIKDKNSYQNLLKQLDKYNQLFWKVINLFPLTEPNSMDLLNLTGVHNTVYHCFYNLLFLVQAYLTSINKELEILTITNEMCSVLGTENIYPAKASLIGPNSVIPLEHPNIKMRIIDVDNSLSQDMDMVARQLLYESVRCWDNVPSIIAWRNSYYWSLAFKNIEFEHDSKLNLRNGGVYLITGGLGGIGLTLIRYIIQNVSSPKFILTARSSFPSQDSWANWLQNHDVKDKTSKLIVSLQEVIKLGAQIKIIVADVSQSEQMQTAISEIKKEFKFISGVIHSAGIAGGGLVQLKQPEVAQQVLSPKIDGTYILTHLLRDEPMDFFVLCSSVASISVASIKGEYSQVDYCAANACLDAFINTNILQNTKLITVINWNTWREVGMAVKTDRPDNIKSFDRGNDISPIDGGRIFLDILRNNYKQVIVSTYDLNAYIKLNQNIVEEDLSNDNPIKRDNIVSKVANYVAPANDLEDKIAKIWQTILGIDKVGINDDFFSLGGHSLMALSLLNKMEKSLGVKISLQLLQELRTIHKIAMVAQEKTLFIQQKSSIIIPIRTTGNNHPMFFVHPCNGVLLCYQRLIDYLTTDSPIYGLQDPSVATKSMMFTTIQQMAASYVEAIKQIQPQGPYIICGYSLGAYYAVEINNQLCKSGEKCVLMLIDGWAKLSKDFYVEEVFKKAISRGINDEQLIDLSWQRMKLLFNYQIPTLSNKTILFKAEVLLPEYQEVSHANNHWGSYSDQPIETHIVPGNHETILEEPNVKVLAEKISQFLNRLY